MMPAVIAAADADAVFAPYAAIFDYAAITLIADIRLAYFTLMLITPFTRQ